VEDINGNRSIMKSPKSYLTPLWIAEKKIKTKSKISQVYGLGNSPQAG